MNRIHPKKLLHSKWTAVEPRNKEKHFLVTKVLRDANDVVQRCVLEAVHSHREYELPWRDLQNVAQWRAGWV